MSMPFVQGFGDEIYRGFGAESDAYGDLQQQNLRNSDNTIVNMYDGLRGPMYQAAAGSNELIGQGSTHNINHARQQAESGMALGNRYNATMDEGTSILSLGDA
jgi:hypothetical protein